MNRFNEDWKKFWHKEQKQSHHFSNDIEEALLPTTNVHKHSSRSTNCRSLIRLYQWICTHKLLSMLIIFVCIPLTLYIFLLLLSTNQALIPKEFQQNGHRLLLVVAHPDDECLFFAPTLRVLQTQHRINLSLLVFSRGNHVGLGEIRARELHGSCQVLNIPKDRCVSLDLANIQDNPKVWWSEEQLIPIINEYINSWSIDFLVSFDDIGISGHMNHRAVGSAVRLLTQNKNNTMIKISYELKSVSILRKYSSFLDFYLVFISLIPRLLHSLLACITPFNFIASPDMSHVLLVSTPHDYWAARTAFSSHQSQFSWDRYIYLIASRYMFINELKYIDSNK